MNQILTVISRNLEEELSLLCLLLILIVPSLFSPSKISLNEIVTNQIGSVESHEVVPPPSGTLYSYNQTKTKTQNWNTPCEQKYYIKNVKATNLQITLQKIILNFFSFKFSNKHGVFYFQCASLCVAEHPEDKQLPVHPASGHTGRVCHHSQLTPTGPDVLRHAHHLQPRWWVPPRRDSFRCRPWFPSVMSTRQLKCELSQCVAVSSFGRVLPEQRRDLIPTGLQFSRALAGLHVGMATASAWPGSS